MAFGGWELAEERGPPRKGGREESGLRVGRGGVGRGAKSHPGRAEQGNENGEPMTSKPTHATKPARAAMHPQLTGRRGCTRITRIRPAPGCAGAWPGTVRPCAMPFVRCKTARGAVG